MSDRTANALASALALILFAVALPAAFILSDRASASLHPSGAESDGGPPSQPCFSGFEIEVDASNPDGAPTPRAAIERDRFASAEPGLVESVVDPSHRVFSNATSSFDVHLIDARWIVTAGTKQTASCGKDAFTGEPLDASV